MSLSVNPTDLSRNIPLIVTHDLTCDYRDHITGRNVPLTPSLVVLVSFTTLVSISRCSAFDCKLVATVIMKIKFSMSIRKWLCD